MTGCVSIVSTTSCSSSLLLLLCGTTGQIQIGRCSVILLVLASKGETTRERTHGNKRVATCCHHDVMVEEEIERHDIHTASYPVTS